MPNTPPLKVFLCYASQDQSAVSRLYNALKKEDWIDPWLAKTKILPGQDWKIVIENAVDNSDAVIICLSNQSITKEGFVQREIRYAYDLALEKPESTIFLIPLRLDNCEVPRGLRSRHYVDYFGSSKKSAFSYLLQALRLRYEQKIEPGSNVGESSGNTPPKKFPLWGIGLIAFAILALSIWGLSSIPTSPKPTQTPSVTQTLFVGPATKTLLPATSTATIISTSTLGIGSIMKSEKDGATLVYVPAGEFTMGSGSNLDEQPIHKVNLDAFWIDQTEVTNKQYAACVSGGGCTPPANTSSFTRTSYYGNSEFDEFPVIYVDWNTANAYCSWAGRELPTEAQWEKAARGTDARIYPWGNNTPNNSLLNYNSNVGDTTKVGSYEKGKSFYGAYDMAGNVWEWVNDWYNVYPGGNLIASRDFGQRYRVLRGGTWSGYASFARSADRDWLDPTGTYNSVGFRCARLLP